MATLSSAKTIGGIGSVLMILSIVPLAGWVLAIIGLILTLVAVKYISEVVGEPKIFRNMMVGIIAAIAGAVVFGIFVVGSLFSFIGLAGIANTGSLGGYTPGTLPPTDFLALMVALITGVAILWIAFIISAVFIRRGYSEIARRLNVGLFGTAALLYLIGAALTIIFVGFIIIFVAIILLTVAFFSIPDQVPQQPVMPTIQAPPPPPPPPIPPPPPPYTP